MRAFRRVPEAAAGDGRGHVAARGQGWQGRFVPRYPRAGILFCFFQHVLFGLYWFEWE
jgi:hypothetical protein